MKQIFVLIACTFFAFAVQSQTKKHRIVFDTVKGDTAFQSTFMLQLNNILNAAPDAELEVVCYGPALFLLVKGRTGIEDQMKALIARGSVSFVACANSMKRNNVKKEELIPLAGIVPVALLELSSKQMEGWSYVKPGF